MKMKHREVERIFPSQPIAPAIDRELYNLRSTGFCDENYLDVKTDSDWTVDMEKFAFASCSKCNKMSGIQFLD